MNNSTIDLARQTESLLTDSELCGAEAARARTVAERLENRRITVSVIGQFKRGKSTLVNAILGEPLLPVGIVPVTSAVTRIQYGERAAEVHFENGAVVPVQIEELSDYISEQKNQDNRLGVASVTMRTPSELLKDGLTLVDTPGVGSAHKHNSDAAYAFVQESDAVIFMLSVDSPINEIEINFLRSAREYAAKFYFAVNKIDTVEEDELEVYLDYCRRLLCSLMEVESAAMFPVSAKQGTGLGVLTETIAADCSTAMKEILERSAKMKLDDIIGSAISQLKLYWNALQMPMSSFDDRFAAMERGFEEVRHKCESAILTMKDERSASETELENELNRRRAVLEMEEEEDSFRSGAEAAHKSLVKKAKRACGKLENGLKLCINEMKQQLSSLVSEQFGMEYHYDIEELNLGVSDEERPSAASMPDGNGRQAASMPDEERLSAVLLPDVDRLLSEAKQDGEIDFAAAAEEWSKEMKAGLHANLGDVAEKLAVRFRADAEGLCGELRESLNRILLYREQNAYTVARRIEDLNQLIRKLKKIRGQL